MKKLITVLSLSTCLVSHALAEFELKWDGAFGFEAGIRHQKKLKGDEKLVSDFKKSSTLYTEGYVGLEARNNLDNDLSYGAKIVLQTTTKPKTAASLNGSHIFIQSDMGLIELGSQHAAGCKMRITEFNITHGSLAWSRYAYLPKDVSFVVGSGFAIDQFRTNVPPSEDTEASRKISYFTPNYKGFSLGISYIMDSSNGGFGAAGQKSATKERIVQVAGGHYLKHELIVRDAFSGGVTYEYDVREDVNIKLALTGEFSGKTKPVGLYDNEKCEKDHKVRDLKLKNLRAYNIGGVLNYSNFSYAASFGSHGKSFTNLEIYKGKLKTNFYSLSAAYEQGPIGASISYFSSNCRGNKLKSITFGTDYKLAPGLQPYFDVSYFQGKGTSLTDNTTVRKVAGTIFVIGTRLRF